jgi:hypothetical protein
MYDDDEDFIDHLILNGALEVVGVQDGTGEMLYGFTDKLIEIDPGLHAKFVDHFYEDMMFLWQNDFISMDVTEPNPLVNLTEKAFDDFAVAVLDANKKQTLATLIKNMSN